MAEEKKMTDFHECDRVEFKCAGVVSKVTPLSVHVRLADLDDIVEMPVPPTHAQEPLRGARDDAGRGNGAGCR